MPWWAGLPVLDVVAGHDDVELVREPQDVQHAARVLAVRLRSKRCRITPAPDVAQQGNVVRVAVLLDEFRVAEHLVVDAQPYLNVSLPGPIYAELLHARTRCLLQPEALHQTDGNLPSREADEVLEGLDDLLFVEVGAQLDGGAGIGEGLELFRLDQVPSRSKITAEITTPSRPASPAPPARRFLDGIV